jgi:hypothetical protein
MCAVLYGDGAAVKEDSKASNDARSTTLMWANNDPEEVRLLREMIAFYYYWVIKENILV